MAYPYSRWETRVSGTTTVKKDWADATDDAIAGIYNGTATMKATVVTWTLVQTYSDGTTTGQRRVYMGTNGSLIIVGNATWTEASAPNGWTQDSALFPSTALLINPNASLGRVTVYGMAAGSAPWSTWTAGTLECGTIYPATVTASGDIVSTTGTVQGKRLGATGSALATTNFTSTGWTSIDAAGGNDQRGYVDVSVGAGAPVNPTVTLTFKDGAFASAPQALAVLANEPGGNFKSISVTTSTTTLELQFNGTPGTGSYRIAWVML